MRHILSGEFDGFIPLLPIARTDDNLSTTLLLLQDVQPGGDSH